MSLVEIKSPLNLKGLQEFTYLMYDWKFPHDIELAIYSTLLYNAIKIDLLSDEEEEHIPPDYVEDWLHDDAPLKMDLNGFKFIIHDTDEKPRKPSKRHDE